VVVVAAAAAAAVDLTIVRPAAAAPPRRLEQVEQHRGSALSAPAAMVPPRSEVRGIAKTGGLKERRYQPPLTLLASNLRACARAAPRRARSADRPAIGPTRVVVVAVVVVARYQRGIERSAV
jgi:hypothetical protein